MSNPTVGIDIVARLDQFKAELAKIGPIGATEARSLTAKLSKEIKAAETAAKKAAEATAAAARQTSQSMRDASNATEAFGNSAGRLGSNAGKLAGIFDMLAPGAGEVARGVADVADVGEVAAAASVSLGVGLGSILTVAAPVVLVVGALTAAWSAYNESVEEAKRKQKQSDDILRDSAELKERVEDARLEAQKALGGEGAIQAENTLIERRWQKSAEASNKILNEKLAELEAAKKVEEDYIRNGMVKHIGARDELNKQIRETRRQISENVKASEEGAGLEKQAAEVSRLKAEADEHVAKKASEKAEALAAGTLQIDNQAEAERQLVAALNEEIAARAILSSKNESTYNDAIEKLISASDASRDARLEGEAKVQRTLEKTKDGYDELAREVLAISGLTTGAQEQLATRVKEAKVEAERTAQAEIEKIQAAAREKKQAQDEQDRQKREQDAAKEIALRRQVASEAAGLFGTMSEAAGMLAEEQGKTSQEAAMQTYKVQKALGITEALINTAVAVSEALTLGPAAVFAVPAAAAAGAMQVAAIAATPPPSFNDTPGVQQMSTRGLVSLASGDFFAAAREPNELRRQVGAMADTRPQVLEVRLGHRVLDRSVARTIRQGGRTARQIERMTGTSVYGHSA